MEEFKKLPRTKTKDLGIESSFQNHIEIIEQNKTVLWSQIEDLVYEIRRLTIEIENLVENYPGDPSYKSAQDSFAKMISEKSDLKNKFQQEYDARVIEAFKSRSTEGSMTINSSSIRRIEDNLN